MLSTVCLLAGAKATCAPADHDPSFGVGGFVVDKPGGTSIKVNAMVAEPDGRVLIGGSTTVNANEEFLLVRHRPDGSPDPAFGANGVVVLPFNSSHDYINDIALQPDGRIVAVGATRIGTTYFCAIGRFLPDGSLDPTFSEDGKQIASLGTGSNYANAVVIQADGRIVAAGASAVADSSVITLMRFLPDGARDPSFGGNGHVRADLGNGSEGATAVALQSDGRIVVAGETRPGGGQIRAVVARFLPDGSLDSGFGSGGWFLPATGDERDHFTAVAVRSDGLVVAAGYAVRNGSFDFVVARLLQDGTLDPSFGDGGISFADFGDSDVCNSMALAPDGKVLLVGSTGYGRLGATDTVAIARFLADGRLDPSFSADGLLRTRFDRSGIGEAVQVQPDGRIVVAGVRGIGGTGVHAVRLMGDPPLPVEALAPPALNRQTGLCEQRIAITNFTGREIGGFDLAISQLPAGVTVNNASGYSGSAGIVAWRQPVPPGASVTVVIEYYATIRGTPIAPVFAAVPVIESEPHPAPTAGGLKVDRCLALADGSLLVEFTATPGALYEVHYSEDGGTWKLSPVRIRAAGNRVQWIDRGPPRTEAPPANTSCRLYRVREVADRP